MVESKPPAMRIHPPWRTMAEEILKAKNRRLYRELRKEGTLSDHIDEQADRARLAYDDLVNRMLKKHPAEESWVFQAAQEVIVRDLLDPTT